MPPIPHAEVLARDWLPPTALGRSREISELVRRLEPGAPRIAGPWVAGVVGAGGSGTSTVARRAAREVADRVRVGLHGGVPRVLAVRTPFLRGPHGVATALVQRMDEGFDGRGFPAPEVLAGLLRRIRRESRPTIVVLDDIGVGGPEIGPILRAFAEPDRFLPEGESGLPPLWTILAGTYEGLGAIRRDGWTRVRAGPFVELSPYAPSALRAIVRDRAERALGHPLVPATVDAIVARSVEDGGGAQRAIELLRRDLLGVSYRERRDGTLSSRYQGISVEPWVVRAIGAASEGQAARLGEVRRLEEELARAHGARPLPTTTLWRRIVRLEQAGYVRREIRPGGAGGTLSVLRLLTPVDEWVTTPHRSESRPADGRWSGSGDPAPAESLEIPSIDLPRPRDVP